MALIDKASLLMVPSTYEAGKLYNVLPSGNRAPDSTDQNSGYDQTRADFDFDRGSNAAATRINSSGLIEKYRENLLLHSNQFDTTWVNSGTTETSGQTDKDGGTDAWLLTKSTADGYIYQNVSKSGVQTYSVYLKANALNWARIQLNGSGADKYAYFDLANGVIGGSGSGNIDENIESVGNGWYRCSIVADTTSTRVRIYPAQADNDVSGTTGSIYIQSAQLETGLVATDVLTSGATTGKAGVLVDMPRINYDANGENGALLLEPQRANLVQYSEYWTGWFTKDPDVTISVNAAISPDGTQNAGKISYDVASRSMYKSVSFTGEHIFSFWVKAEGSNISKTFNFRLVNTGASTANHSVPLTDEWVRHDFQFTNTNLIEFTNRYGTTIGTGEFLLFGLQIEAGSYASSYIPNHGESGGVTRAADSCSVTGASDVIGQTEGTILFDWNYLSNDGDFDFRFNLSDGAAVAEWIIVGMTNTNARAYVTSGGSVQFDSNDEYAITIGNRYKMALAYANNNFAFYINGTQVATSSSGSVPTGMDYISMSDRPNAIASVIKASVNQTALFKERLSNAELATLTTL